jgi:hypothetical protein
MDAVAAGDARPDQSDAVSDRSPDAASEASCDVGCSTKNTGDFCGAGEVTWLCTNSFDRVLFNANCHDAATNAIRYCCPPAFLAACR